MSKYISKCELCKEEHTEESNRWGGLCVKCGDIIPY